MASTQLREPSPAGSQGMHQSDCKAAWNCDLNPNTPMWDANVVSPALNSMPNVHPKNSSLKVFIQNVLYSSYKIIPSALESIQNRNVSCIEHYWQICFLWCADFKKKKSTYRSKFLICNYEIQKALKTKSFQSQRRLCNIFILHSI